MAGQHAEQRGGDRRQAGQQPFWVPGLAIEVTFSDQEAIEVRREVGFRVVPARPMTGDGRQIQQ